MMKFNGILWLVLFCSFNGFAEETELNQYEAKIEIPDQQVESQNKAIQTALKAVLMRTSQNKAILKQAKIKKALKKSRQLVQQYRFLSESQPDSEKKVLLMKIAFYPQEIDELIGKKKAVISPPSSPQTSITTWVLFDDVILGNENKLVQKLKYWAKQSHLLLVLPMLDLEDQAMLNSNQLAQFDIQQIKNASVRYKTDLILMLHLQKQADLYFLDAVLLNQQIATSWQEQAEENVIFDYLFQWIKKQKQNKTSIDNTSINQNRYQIVIKNIMSAMDYLRIQNYFSNNTLIESSRLIQMDSQQLIMEIKLAGKLSILQQQPRFNVLFEVIESTDNNQLMPVYQLKTAPPVEIIQPSSVLEQTESSEAEVISDQDLAPDNQPQKLIVP